MISPQSITQPTALQQQQTPVLIAFIMQTSTDKRIHLQHLKLCTYVNRSRSPMATTPTLYGWAQRVCDSVKLAASPAHAS